MGCGWEMICMYFVSIDGEMTLDLKNSFFLFLTLLSE